jgi:endonuclease YncB( thermonuclease family)
MNFIKFLILVSITINLYSEEIIGKVVGISDGDTIKLVSNNKQIKVRLFGIDAPERDQEFGTKSKEFLSSLVFKKEIKLITKSKDQYGRTLGTIYLDDKNINLEMVKNGYAWVYRKFNKDSEFMNSEAEAKEKKLGLWVDKEPTPPWLFRKTKRSR